MWKRHYSTWRFVFHWFLPCITSRRVHQDYATEGLRTLCVAVRDISEAEYRQWAAIYDQAAATINGRVEALDQAAELIEKDMFLLGATAVEDKLQDGVPDTIHTLQLAGIKVHFGPFCGQELSSPAHLYRSGS
jgi:magnesium-transporting ATPase (P-type)